jgi:hypothetical protein
MLRRQPLHGTPALLALLSLESTQLLPLPNTNIAHLRAIKSAALRALQPLLLLACAKFAHLPALLDTEFLLLGTVERASLQALVP